MERDRADNRPLRIAFLTPEFPHEKSEKSAGLGSSIKNLALALVAKGVVVSVFVYEQKFADNFEVEGIKVHLLQGKTFPFLSWYFDRKRIQKIVNKFIEKDQIDLVETQDWTGIAACMKLKTSLVIRLHGSDAYFCDLEGRVQKKKNFWMEKKGLEAANHIVSVSDFTAKKTTEIFDINNKIDIIYNGINIKMFSPTDIAIEENSLLYFGSVIRKKGVLALAKAFNLLHQKNSNATLTFL